MGLREYARHRGGSRLPGATLRAVQKAIEAGRISTVPDDKGRARIDPQVADIQWGRNTDPDQSARANPGKDISPSGGSASGSQGAEREGSRYWDAKTEREEVELAKAKLQLAKDEGSLVSREAVERAAFEAGRLLRDMILSVPNRLAPEVAGMTEPPAIEVRLREELRKVLDELARLTRTGMEQVEG